MSIPPAEQLADKFDRVVKKLMGVRKRPDPRKSDVPIFASFQDRVFASMIDVCLVFIVFQDFIIWLKSFCISLIGDLSPMITPDLSSDVQSQTPDAEAQLVQTLQELGAAAVMTFSSPAWLLEQFLTSLLLGLIFVGLWSRFHTTPGKFLLGLNIAGENGEGAPDLRTYLRRFAACYLSMPPLMIGYAVLGFDAQKRAWHDRMAGTTVIYTREGHIFRRVWDMFRRALFPPKS